MGDGILIPIDRDEAMKTATFGRAFRIARVDAKVTMRELADHIGCTVPQLSDMERDRAEPFDIETMDKALKRMGLSMADQAAIYRLRELRTRVDPKAWMQLPPDAQRILSGRLEAKSIELWFEDDGTPIFSPAQMGEFLGCLLVPDCANYLDALRVATEFTELMAKR